MKNIIKHLKKLWIKSTPFPHTCKFECIGYCTHYGMATDLDFVVKNPTAYHYPPQPIIMNWIKQGFKVASTFQSHWACDCGKKFTFFFLAHPHLKTGGKANHTISIQYYNGMILANPFDIGASAGKSLNEVTDSLINELCWNKI